MSADVIVSLLYTDETIFKLATYLCVLPTLFRPPRKVNTKNLPPVQLY